MITRTFSVSARTRDTAFALRSVAAAKGPPLFGVKAVVVRNPWFDKLTTNGIKLLPFS